MADLKARLTEDLKEAMRARDRIRLGALRLLSAAVKNREVELRREVTDEEFVEVVGREVKRRKEAAEAYEKAGRQDLLDTERGEQEVLEGFMPEQLGADKVRALVEEAVTATGASGPKDIGKVMAHVMTRAKGRADGKTVNELAKARLAGG